MSSARGREPVSWFGDHGITDTGYALSLRHDDPAPAVPAGRTYAAAFSRRWNQHEAARLAARNCRRAQSTLGFLPRR